MYQDKEKVRIIGEVLNKMNSNMDKIRCLDENDKEEQDPTV